MLKSALVFLLILGSSLTASALGLQLEGDYSIVERDRAEKALRVVMATLPEELTRALSYTIQVNFQKVSKTSSETIHLGKPAYLQKRILLNREYLNPNNQQPQLSEQRLYRTLAHEVAHFYDIANVEAKNIQELRDQCRDEFHQKSFLCKTLQKKGLTISEDPEFMALTGWVESGTGIKNINQFTRRLSDIYANESVGESFPSLFEFYLFDPDFACRMPALNTYFNNKFKMKKTASCGQTMTWYIHGDDLQFVNISRKQIWAVDYFWADKGSGIVSGFGHSMLRLVICSPTRNPGPDCYKDFAHHIMLSFGATSPTGAFANYAGLSGKYPLNLYAMSFHKARSDYNHTELRDLYAVPLKLERSHFNRLIDQLYEAHWNQNADYYFVTRNCTTEISRLILGSGVDLSTALNLQMTTPIGFFERLFTSPLTYSQYRRKEDLRKNDLLYFPSRQETVNIALGLVSQAIDMRIKTMDHYIQKIDENLFAKLHSASLTNKKLRYAAYYLENIRFLRIQSQELMKNLDKNEEAQQLFQKASAGEAQLNYSYRFPGSFLPEHQGYGIPNAQEVVHAQRFFTERREKDTESLIKLAQQFSDYQNRSFKKVEGARTRLKALAELLKNR